jgi:hypothetical protein
MANSAVRCAVIRGNEEFGFDIVGEARYQADLEIIAEGRTTQGARNPGPHVAVLSPEPDNPYDSLAVRVQIGEQIVGYLPRYETEAFRSALTSGQWDAAACHALLVGGWKGTRGRDQGSFGVRLNIVLPYDFIDPDTPPSPPAPAVVRPRPWWKRLVGD